MSFLVVADPQMAAFDRRMHRLVSDSKAGPGDGLLAKLLGLMRGVAGSSERESRRESRDDEVGNENKR